VTHRVFILGTTSRPGNIDPALRRPGRLDKEIEISAPSVDERRAILKVMCRKLLLDTKEESLDKIARQAHGMVAADLLYLCKEATFLSMQRRMKEGFYSMDSLEERCAGLSLHEDTRGGGGGGVMSTLLWLNESDMLKALSRTTPSALR
jgi:AAA family ATPase